MNGAELELDVLKDELLTRMWESGLLELAQKYWAKRAEFSSRSITQIVDADTSNMAKGQISICYETADEIRRTLELRRAEANAQGNGRISDAGLSAV